MESQNLRIESDEFESSTVKRDKRCELAVIISGVWYCGGLLLEFGRVFSLAVRTSPNKVGFAALADQASLLAPMHTQYGSTCKQAH